jgi:hypothetical protein
METFTQAPSPEGVSLAPKQSYRKTRNNQLDTYNVSRLNKPSQTTIKVSRNACGTAFPRGLGLQIINDNEFALPSLGKNLNITSPSH